MHAWLPHPVRPPAPGLAMTGWRKPSRCVSANCVWVDIQADVVLVTGTTQFHTLAFTHDEWATFAAAMRAGEFDLPAVQP